MEKLRAGVDLGLPATRIPRWRRLSTQLLAAVVLLVALVGVSAYFVSAAISAMSRRDAQVDRADRVLAQSSEVERLVVDAENGMHGWTITRQQRFLEPLTAARMQLPAASARLAGLAGVVPAQAVRAAAIQRAVDEWLADWVDRVVASPRPVAMRLIESGRGKASTDAIRSRFRALDAAATAIRTRRQAEARAGRRSALVIGASALAAALLLLAVVGLYVRRRIVTPLARLASAFGRLSPGDPGVTVPVTGSAETSLLAHRFNEMTSRLHEANERLRQVFVHSPVAEALVGLDGRYLAAELTTGGIATFVQKPFAAAELLHAIDEALRLTAAGSSQTLS